MSKDDDLLIFADEASGPLCADDATVNWWILIVDDDRDVHESTEYALKNLIILGRTLRFLHAFTAAEALEVLQQHQDIAVIFLDVVMETVHAGLDLVEIIRSEFGMHDVRIILRTGQPGYAPEMEAIRRYEINDYQSKNELSRSRIYTSLTAALRSYQQLQCLNANRTGLSKILDATHRFLRKQSLQSFAEEVLTQTAAFLGVPASGLMCMASATDAEPMVIGCLGHYQALVGRYLSELVEPQIADRVKRCLQLRCSLDDERHWLLFCDGQNDNDFVLYIDRDQHQGPDRELINVFCNNVGLSGDNLALICRLRQTATFDELVKLPNRLAFLDAVDHKLATANIDDQIAALLDIDGFAEINDILGSQYGDDLLRALANCLQQQLSPSIVIARVAGGRFAVLGGQQWINPEYLQKLFASPLIIEGSESLISISMGFVRLQDYPLANGSKLFQGMCIALKQAKVGGLLGQTAYYTLATHKKIRESASLLEALRINLKNGCREFSLHYQPQIDLHNHRCVGLEALIRWQTTKGERLMPDRFIPIAEQSGLIIEMGKWILNTALIDLRALHDLGFEAMRMAVNVSVVEFRNPAFIENVRNCLQVSGVAATCLELEITESVAVIGMEVMQSLLNKLKAMGCIIALDDFGTGYSSLSYLDRLPADRLKIDRSFVELLDTPQQDARIIEVMIPLGRRLGMRVLAEGVETANQLRTLQHLGCEEVQGFYIAKPMPFADLVTWLKRHDDEILP